MHACNVRMSLLEALFRRFGYVKVGRSGQVAGACPDCPNRWQDSYLPAAAPLPAAVTMPAPNRSVTAAPPVPRLWARERAHAAAAAVEKAQAAAADTAAAETAAAAAKAALDKAAAAARAAAEKAVAAAKAAAEKAAAEKAADAQPADAGGTDEEWEWRMAMACAKANAETVPSAEPKADDYTEVEDAPEPASPAATVASPANDEEWEWRMAMARARAKAAGEAARPIPRAPRRRARGSQPPISKHAQSHPVVRDEPKVTAKPKATLTPEVKAALQQLPAIKTAVSLRTKESPVTSLLERQLERDEQARVGRPPRTTKRTTDSARRRRSHATTVAAPRLADDANKPKPAIRESSPLPRFTTSRAGRR